MAQIMTQSFLIAAPQTVAEKLEGILASAQIVPNAVMYSAEAAIEAAAPGSVLLTTYRLPDMAGEALVEKLDESVDVLMIVPQDYEAELPDRVLLLRNPLSQDTLCASVRTLMHCKHRLNALNQKAQKAERTLEERKVIDRAKGRIMDELRLTEKEAHHRIQKKSMDSGKRIVDVAREILESETIEL